MPWNQEWCKIQDIFFPTLQRSSFCELLYFWNPLDIFTVIDITNEQQTILSQTVAIYCVRRSSWSSNKCSAKKYYCSNRRIGPHSASSTGQIALVSSVPLAHVLAVGEGIEAGVTWCQNGYPMNLCHIKYCQGQGHLSTPFNSCEVYKLFKE